MENISQEKIIENLKRCSHFERCSQNLCPLDLELSLRVGATRDECRYMRRPRQVKIGGKEFVSGGTVAPDAVLNFTPSENLDRLNESSKKRWEELNKLKPKK